MNGEHKITSGHRDRAALVYQSSMAQVRILSPRKLPVKAGCPRCDAGAPPCRELPRQEVGICQEDGTDWSVWF